MPEIQDVHLTYASAPDGLAGEMRAALDMVSEAILFVDAFELRIVEANEAAIALLEVPRGALVGESLWGFLPDLDPHTETFDALLHGRRDEVALCTTVRSVHGRVLPLQLGLRWGDHDLSPVLIVLIRRLDDRGDPRSDAAPARDALTGLPARDWWIAEADRALHRAQHLSRQCAVLFIDLDEFKWINDSFGHLTGDAVLEIVGRRLASCMRPYDALSRFGGDEFVALITDVSSEDDLQSIHDRIHQSLRQPMSAAGISLTISASIGVACSGADDVTPQDLIGRADRAMYAAKRSKQGGPACASAVDGRHRHVAASARIVARK